MDRYWVININDRFNILTKTTTMERSKAEAEAAVQVLDQFHEFYSNESIRNITITHLSHTILDGKWEAV